MPETPTFSFRLPPDFRWAIEEAAAAEHRSIASMMLVLLHEALTARACKEQPKETTR
jgi:hypothetical protein